MPHVLEIEFFDQAFQLLSLVFLAEMRHLQHRADIVLDTHLPEHARLLRQIADTQLRALVHRKSGEFLIV